MHASLRKSAIPISLLALIVIVAAGLRLDHITKPNLWLDEFWTLYLATGRGDSAFQLPLNTILWPPPALGFAGAPPWWHIWNGVDSTTHPPLYHIILRLWVDLLGDGDGSIRTMSTLFSLACVVLLYVVVLKSSGDRWQACVAAALMALAPVQIVLSQQVRPYTMMQFIALVAAVALLSIEQTNWSWRKLLILALAVIALTLTHYFSVGLIAAFAAYSILRLRGKNRIAAFSTIVLAAFIAAAAWGPNFLAYNRGNPLTGYGTFSNRTLPRLALSVPQRLTLESNNDQFLSADNASWPLVISLAIITYLIPAFRLRRHPHLLFWWLWIVGQIGLVLMIDVARHSTLLTIARYTTLAAPGVYAILAVGLPSRIGNWSPPIIFFCAMIFAVDHWLLGPPNSQDLRTIANLVRPDLSPSDVVIITGNYYQAANHEPPLTYFVLSRYAGTWNSPVVFATAPLSDQTQLRLRQYKRIWVIGIDPSRDTNKILPGWQVHDVHGPGGSNLLWSVTPGNARNS
ncbi:MAG: glycosyltransferase family 39 protein [Tepidisphaeraceae bacterium]